MATLGNADAGESVSLGGEALGTFAYQLLTGSARGLPGGSALECPGSGSKED